MPLYPQVCKRIDARLKADGLKTRVTLLKENPSSRAVIL
jgi:hypothetical protein